MSETPIYDALAEQYKLTGFDIESSLMTTEERASAEFQRDQVESNPPIFTMVERNHADVAELREEVAAEQPSMVEQHEHMTHEQKVAYMVAMTPRVAYNHTYFARVA